MRPRPVAKIPVRPGAAASVYTDGYTDRRCPPPDLRAYTRPVKLPHNFPTAHVTTPSRSEPVTDGRLLPGGAQNSGGQNAHPSASTVICEAPDGLHQRHGSAGGREYEDVGSWSRWRGAGGGSTKGSRVASAGQATLTARASGVIRERPRCFVGAATKWRAAQLRPPRRADISTARSSRAVPTIPADDRTRYDRRRYQRIRSP